MKLSEHFSLEEFTESDTAARKGISNAPPPEIVIRLRYVAERLELIRRDVLRGAPIAISSGYRSPALNKAVGGASSSAHCAGYAVDFKAPAFGSPLKVAQAIAANPEAMAGVDQLIHEFGRWVHISFDPRARKQLLTVGAAWGGAKRTAPGLVEINKDGPRK